MTANCRKVREQLLREHGRALAELETHLAGCADCEQFASRLDGLRAALHDHHARVEPDAGFAARVSVRLVRDPAADLGWVAARLLPVTLVLLGLMAWIAFQTPLPAVEVVEVVEAAESESEDLLSWVIADSSGETP